MLQICAVTKNFGPLEKLKLWISVFYLFFLIVLSFLLHGYVCRIPIEQYSFYCNKIEIGEVSRKVASR